MTTRQRVLATMLATLAVSTAARSAGTADSPFSLEFSSGFEYDSTVAVLELDQSSGGSDVAALIDLGLGFDGDVSDRWRVDFEYDFSQSLHDRFTEFDVRIHRGTVGARYDFGASSVGATMLYADAALDDEGFLVMKQAAPYLSRRFGKRLLLRAAYSRTEKELATDPGRNATVDSPSVDAFLFARGARSHVLVGYRRLREDAVEDQLDYEGAKVKLQVSHRVDAGAREVVLRAGFRYENRDYGRPLLPLDEPRRDDRYRYEAHMDVPLFERGFFRAKYEYADHRSNESGVAFDEHVASIGFGVRL